ncbi:glyoxalase domain protein [Natrialba magadii ATCC 43099]|uniref:Glyoxalase domain protein n=1 Tax=Natrialba magadii (strain ATCC 43099 / DSM 3394 / CCM 3739 / CIP 104546 / IAM 13178 / JCM 8861 / NBRC 102185 / NCIMB 2190 / MS3) TaxID=547559 RepID=D3SWR2_NATMM|nr:VOC family protein [Natrialba magadii]ADD05794.1 glyoxalase domain protein [Natrialba magadii ATCC 43099]ELY30130.1 glyoxalase/bleomycin resistance protein/dioxygenase [Natrialba magadii ATCC 43099]
MPEPNESTSESNDTRTEPNTDRTDDRPQLVGINHVALEVGDIEDALEFYESLFAFDLRGRSETTAFLDMGDQFIALSETADAAATGDEKRHFGLVVDDLDAAERRLDDQGVDRLDVPGLEFRDPWGNRIQLVEYGEIQFTKAEHVREGMGLELEKSADAIAELAEKGLEPES